MAKYEVEYGFDVPAYGRKVVSIEAETDEELKQEILGLYSRDELIDSWDTMAEVGCENHRVIGVSELRGEERIARGLYFSLDREPATATDDKPVNNITDLSDRLSRLKDSELCSMLLRIGAALSFGTQDGAYCPEESLAAGSAADFVEHVGDVFRTYDIEI